MSWSEMRENVGKAEGVGDKLKALAKFLHTKKLMKILVKTQLIQINLYSLTSKVIKDINYAEIF
jgi:hypothetical protein